MIRLETLRGADLSEAIDDIARLRIAVFRDWPYLYDGDLDYERHYLQSYLISERAIVIGAYDGDWLVGAATATPLADHASDFQQAFEGHQIDIQSTFYCGESVLLPRYRGRGTGRHFFDKREEHARSLGYQNICFCAVIRPDDHPLRPSEYRPLDGFWQKRGYARLPGVVAHFKWKDVDQRAETTKALQFWQRTL